MIISYKLSGKSIGALKKKGLSDKAVTELRSMVDVYFDSSETFIQRVNQLESSDEIMAQEQQLLKLRMLTLHQIQSNGDYRLTLELRLVRMLLNHK